MARIDPDQPLLPSLIDRLIDDDPGTVAGMRRSRGQFLRELRDAVRRDIENLLNTRQRCRSPDDELDELSVSLPNYGIPDFTALNLASSDAQYDFCRVIEEQIRAYEPRLFDIRVTLNDSGDGDDRTLRLRIAALLKANPAPEPIEFTSFLDPGKRKLTVIGAQR
jgi:type VI secretion system protein ImpF